MHATYIYAHTTHYLKHIVTQNTHTKRTLPTTAKPPHSESTATSYVSGREHDIPASFFLSSSPPPSPSHSTSYNPHRFNNTSNVNTVVIQSHRPSLRQPKTLRTQSQTTTSLNFPPPPNPKSRPKGNPSLISTFCPNPALPTYS